MQYQPIQKHFSSDMQLYINQQQCLSFVPNCILLGFLKPFFVANSQNDNQGYHFFNNFSKLLKEQPVIKLGAREMRTLFGENDV